MYQDETFKNINDQNKTFKNIKDSNELLKLNIPK